MKPVKALRRLGAALIPVLVGMTGAAAGPEIVDSPTADPACFAPWSADTTRFQYPAKDAPFRIALSNGLDTNNWRKQMLATARACAARPEIKSKLSEFVVRSTGEDVASQVSAVEALVAEGYDAIIIDAESATAFADTVERANDAGTVIVSFDNTLAGDNSVTIDVELGAAWAEWIVENVADGGRLLVVRGVRGVTADIDRYAGIEEKLNASGATWDIVETYGQWANSVAREAAAKALADHPEVVGVIAGGGDIGVIDAMIAAKQPFVPYGGEDQNGFRKLCARYAEEGLKCRSGGTGPAQVAVAIKAAIAALEGQVIPQAIRLPLSIVDSADLKPGVNYYPDAPDTLYVGGSFPGCDIDLSAQEIMEHATDK